MAGEPEPLLDGADIQGNILPGLTRTEQLFVAFASTDQARLQRALAALKPRLTTMATALTHRDARKRAFVMHTARPQRSDLWVNLALSVRATNALGAPEVAKLDRRFALGMRPGAVGDPTAATLPDGRPNPAHQSNWEVGSPTRPVDLFLIFAHDHDIANHAAPIIAEIAAVLGSEPVYREQGRILPDEIEHFGFRDGISQVGVRGNIRQDGVERPVTTRYGVPSRDGIDFGKAGQALVWPGQFLTGQPTFAGEQPELAPEFTNGSFLVFRRLRQDVKTFYADTESLAQKLSADTGRTISASDLRNLLVGRFPSGASLMRHEHEPTQSEGPNEINYFAFGTELPSISLDDGTVVAASAADPDILRGRRCPVWAHIRKVNPRDLGTNQGGASETLGFQMLRRGIPFGPLYDHTNADHPDNACERGLLFLSYQRKIEDQFGFLNRDWMNNQDAPSAGGFDLLVGQNVPDNGGGLHAPKTATFFGPAAAGSNPDGIPFQVSNQWVIPTGGAFLFAPSLAFIDKFASALVA
jgi:Dyp-type peroxidase family